MKPVIFITRTLPEEVIQPLREIAEVRMWNEVKTPMPYEELSKALEDVDALWTMLTDKVDRALLDCAPKLKIVSNLAVGFNNIDIEAAKEKGIVVTNTPGVLTNTTADLTFALMLASARRLNVAEKAVREGEWSSWSAMEFTGMDVFGATIGIIGMGRIGQAVARRATGFDMKVLYHNRNRQLDLEQAYGYEYAELETLLKESDFVVLLTPFTKETEGLIGKQELSLMKRTAILVNVARGGIVDEQALYEALVEGQIWGAALDVFEVEPVPVDHPLLSLPNVTVLPHIGSASISTRQAMMQMNAEAIRKVLLGQEVQNRIV